MLGKYLPKLKSDIGAVSTRDPQRNAERSQRDKQRENGDDQGQGGRVRHGNRRPNVFVYPLFCLWEISWHQPHARLCSSLLLNTTRFEPEPVVKRSGRWLRHSVERLAEQAFAQEKLRHLLHPLAESGVARHQHTLGIFTARVRPGAQGMCLQLRDNMR